MISHIVIPTLGRIHNQITYNNLPDKYKNITKFIVQHHEFEKMAELYGDKVICLPKEINTIAPTREWIFNNFKDSRHMVFDDDLNFTVKEPNKDLSDGAPKWISWKYTDSDFDDMFNTIDSWMDEGIVFGGLGTTWIVPSINLWPYSENYRVMTNTFYNGPLFPVDIKWDRVPAAEDFDVTLQLLTSGIKNRISTKYMVNPSDTNTDGGCSVWRNIDVHNESQIKLSKLWPDFVKTKEKTAKSGPWKGLTKLTTHIQFKKAYKYGVAKLENSENSLFRSYI